MASAAEDEKRTYKFEELSPTAKKRAIEKFQQYAHEDFDVKQLTETFKERLDEVGLPSDDIRWSLSYSQGDGVGFSGHIDIKDYLKKNKLSKDYASLFAPAYEDVEKEGRTEIKSSVRTKMRQHADIVADGMRDLGYEATVRETPDCALVDVVASNDETEWIASFCVAPKGRSGTTVLLESEREPGTGSYLFKRARIPEHLESGKAARESDYGIPIDEVDFMIPESRYFSIRVEHQYTGHGALDTRQERDLEALAEHLQEHAQQVAHDLARLGYEDIEWQTSEENIREMLEANDYEFDEDGNLE